MRLNDEIKGVSEVRLLDEEGEMIGVVPFERAIKASQDAELDLCEISPNAAPPVCRIMDYGKFKYQQKKKEHENEKRHKGHDQKQIRIKSFRIDDHDLAIKLKKARKFIEAEHRVLVTLMFRARENDHPELGVAILKDKFFEQLKDVSVMVAPPKKEGRRMTMTLAPVPNIHKVLERRKIEEERAARMAEKIAANKAAGIEEEEEVVDNDAPEIAAAAAIKTTEVEMPEAEEVTEVE